MPAGYIYPVCYTLAYVFSSSLSLSLLHSFLANPPPTFAPHNSAQDRILAYYPRSVPLARTRTCNSVPPDGARVYLDVVAVWRFNGKRARLGSDLERWTQDANVWLENGACEIPQASIWFSFPTTSYFVTAHTLSLLHFHSYSLILSACTPFRGGS